VAVGPLPERLPKGVGMRLRTVVVLLLLGLAAGASAATAAESHTRIPHRAEAVSTQGQLALLGPVGAYFVSIWSNIGCRIDPLGRCAPDQNESAPPPAAGDSSGEALEADAGCIIDPWGACAQSR
jgi:hypothetical protein